MKNEMHLRRIDKNYIDLLLRWVNDSSVSAGQINLSLINYDDHVKYCNRFIESQEKDVYILVDDNIGIGILVLDFDNQCVKLGFSISFPYRGCNYEKILIQLAENEILGSKRNIVSVICSVNKNNIALCRIFEDMKYEKIEKETFIEYIKNMDKLYFNHLVDKNIGGVLLLSNNSNCFSLYDNLVNLGEEITLVSEHINLCTLNNCCPDYCISYNYSYIIQKEVIQYMNDHICNIHISYLPWNRGSDPNFWSFIDNTPKGVTIHRVEAKVDAGDVLVQGSTEFDESSETFASTYSKLNKMGVAMLIDKWKLIKNNEINGIVQSGKGSYHKHKDFIEFTRMHPLNWNMVINDYRSSL